MLQIKSEGRTIDFGQVTYDVKKLLRIKYLSLSFSLVLLSQLAYLLHC